MKFNFTYILFLILPVLGFSQEVGDTIKVSVLDYSMDTRDLDVQFPSDDLSFERIIMKYNMRCTDGLVSDGVDRNRGCGEWDYSCNTFVVDSNKVEAIPASINNFLIVDYDESTLPYSESPVYNYINIDEKTVTYTANSETSHQLGTAEADFRDLLSTDKQTEQSYFIYTAEELTASGLTAGPISGLDMSIGDQAGSMDFFKIQMKSTQKTSLTSDIDFSGFSEVYIKSEELTPNDANRFQFHFPFLWDGNSNIIVEMSFNNTFTTSGATDIKGYATDKNDYIVSDNGQEMILTNNTYIEADDYLGIAGSTNRTIEAWIKSSEITNGEILSYGSDINSKKWVFRVNNEGQLRVEINGGGTVSSGNVIDGKWHHVACVLNGSNLSNISFYIDGERVTNSSTGNLGVNTELNDTRLVRVSRGINNRYHDGSIDEVRMWDTALTEETIKSWMNMNITPDHPNYANLQLEYKFDEESGKTVLDNSGNNRNAQVIGEPIRTVTPVSGHIFKEYKSVPAKPVLTFYQGDYDTSVSVESKLYPIGPAAKYVIERTIVPSENPGFAVSDEILVSDPALYYLATSTIYDEVDGNVIETIEHDVDGTLVINGLDYTIRYPFYNEILSFVTPYGIGLDLGLDGESWFFDVTEFAPILKGNKRFLMALGGQNQEQMDIEFWFIVGTPMREVLDFNQLWQGAARGGSHTIANVRNEVSLPKITVPLHPNGDQFLIKSTVTGHGAQGEFAQNGGQIFHSLDINDEEIEHLWNAQQECSLNPIYPQGGTWVYDRQGWCPGEVSHTETLDITEGVTAGEDAIIDYDISAPLVTTGDYRYIVAHQLITYGEMNFESDARILDVIKPTDIPVYGRINPVCERPIVKVQNSGKNEITSITFQYKTNDNDPVTYEWTGNVSSQEIIEIELPSNGIFDNLKADGNVAHFEIEKVNGAEDDYSHNNTMETTFEITDHLVEEFIVYVKTNSIPSQNSYKIYDSNDNEIFSNSLSNANAVYRDTFALNGCYRLEFLDTGGDGLTWWANSSQGSGNFSIKNLSNDNLRTFNPDFGGGLTYSFTAETSSGVNDQELTDKVNLYPNPAREYLSLEMEFDKDYEIECYDIVGKKVPVNYSINKNKYVLDIRDLNAGIYMVNIKSEGQQTSRKFVVTK